MDTNLHIRLNKELKESFQEIAKGNNTDPSSLVRDWIGNYVAEHRKTDEDSPPSYIWQDSNCASTWRKGSCHQGIR